MMEANSREIICLMQKIQKEFLNYLENDNTEENFENLKSILEEYKICNDKHELQLLLHLIVKIANNHYRGPDFHGRIEKILQLLKDSIKKNYSNSVIFNIFKSNKRILLFLLEERIIFFDEYIVKTITNNDKYINAKYPLYFQPEIKPFINEKWFPTKSPSFYGSSSWIREIKEEIPENFYELRKNGENIDPICALIRKDLTKDFISYIDQNNVKLGETIKNSKYETNPLLAEGRNSLIEYAVFYGSIEIFNYLRTNEVKLDQSLWKFAIHSKNLEIIRILEDNNIKPQNESYEIFIESIKCHHNEIANYIMNNYLKEKDDISQILFNQSLKYYNFAFIKNEFINGSTFYNLCKFDYCKLVNDLLKNKEIDINKKVPKSTRNVISNHMKWEKEREKQEKSPFQIAVEKENIEIIHLLLNDERLDLNATYFEYSSKIGGCSNEYYKSEKNPFYTAVEKENIEIIKLLINNEKIDVNIPYKRIGYIEGGKDSIEETRERSALYIAISKENIEIIQLLLTKEKLDINFLSKYSYCNGHNDKGESKWEVEEITPFCLAIKTKSIEIINLLINNEKLDINIPYKVGDEMRKNKKIIEDNVKVLTAFYLAVMIQNIEIVKLLLENENVDINIPFKLGTTENSAFCLAVENADIEIIKLLLNNEKLCIKDTNKLGGHYYYNKKTHSDWMAELMGLKTSNMEDAIMEKTEFFIAVENKNIEVIKLLLECGKIDPNIPYKCIYYKDKEWIAEIEMTPFYKAVVDENIEIIQLLLNNEKIDINIPITGEGQVDENIIVEAEKTAFYWAVEKEKVEIIKLLLNNEKIDINFPYKCSENATAYLKSQKIKLKVIQDILNGEDFDINFQNQKRKSKKTPLHCAVEKGDAGIVELLLTNKNIDVDAKDKQGKTPADYAKNDIIKQLLNQ